ncbi:MAG: hypothetical protein WCC95_20045 [Candidatus Sulfotelmatobacter sp.]
MKYRILLALLSLLCVPPASAQVYSITNLGNFSPTAINSWGQVVGNRNGEAFVWAQFTGLKGLGKLPGGSASYAASINDLGVVTGTADGAGTVISQDPIDYPNLNCSDLTQPFVWIPGKGMKGLGTVGVPPYETNAPFWCGFPFYATGINDIGQVTGYTIPYEDNYQWAFLWTSANGWKGAAPLFGSSFPPNVANGIANSGQIVGQTGIFLGQATSWKNGVATDLGTLNDGIDLDYSSSANAINQQGQVVGWSTTESLISSCDADLVGCPMHAALWTRSGVISDLGTLPGDELSMATNINFFGQVIGNSGNTLAEQGWGGNGGSGFEGNGGSVAVIGRAFVWSQCNGMQDLNTLIPSGSGWVLNSVSGINNWGQIVGTGTVNGQTRGFLLTPRGFQCL